MSSPASKRKKDVPHLRLVPKTNTDSAGPLPTPSFAPSEAAPAAPDAADAVFASVFQALKALVPGGDILIGRCSPLATDCQIGWAAGAFEKLKGQTLNVARGPFADALAGMDTQLIAQARELGESDPALRMLNAGGGDVAILRVDLAGDLSALILYWQPEGKGPLLVDRVDGLRALADLASQAACASDLTLDVQAQQLHLNTLRAEIEEVQQFYRQFSDAIRQCFWILDADTGQVLVVSDNFERVWGAPKQILYTEIAGFMSNALPADRDRVLADFHHNLGGELDTELRVFGPDGEVRWIWLRAYPSREAVAPGEPRRIVLIADDITEKKTEEESRREREAGLVATARTQAIGDLASGVAHEINNPLSIIVGTAAEVKNHLKRPQLNQDAAWELVDKIQKTSIRISEIVSSLKSLSRPEKRMMSRTPFARLVTELRDMISERFKSSGVHLEIADLPQGLSADINETLVSQMVLNLMTNAFDAVQKEKDKWVKLDFAEDDHSVFIFVSDSGPGIPIVIRSRIFDPFFTTKDPGKGTGLGLSLASGIAAHHGGTLRLDTMHPHTRFVAQIPKRQAAQKSA